MLKGYSVLLVLLTGLFFLGCNRGESPLGPEELKLEGTWSEDFNYDYLIFYSGSYIQPGGIPETSELTFSAGRFTLRFPGHSSRSVTDPMSVERTGKYKVNNGVMVLLIDGEASERKFTVKYNGDAITISTFNYVNEDGSISVAMWSFLWGNSYHKTSGEFTKKPLQ